MEVLLMAAVAAAGYEISRRSEERELERSKLSRRRKSVQVPVEELSDIRPGGMAYMIQKAHYDAAANPRETGVFDPLSGPELVPLPRGRTPLLANERKIDGKDPFPVPAVRTSERASEKRDDGFDRSVGVAKKDVERFVGDASFGTGDSSDTGTWRHKVESAPRFAPSESAVRVRSSGSGGNPGSSMRAPVISGTQNNVLPTNSVAVGRGVGYGPNVPAADGFHPYFRALPNNVGVYKKNNLPGGFVPGKNPVDSRASQFYTVDSYKPPKFYDLKRRPLGPNMAAVTAPRRREDEPREVCHGHDLSEQYFGNPHLVEGVEGRYSGADNSHSTRQSTGNERAARSGTDAIGPGTYIPAPGMGKDEFRMDEGRFEKLHNYETDRAGGPVKTLVSSGVAENPANPQPTVRQQTTARPYGHFLGIAAPTGHFVQQAPGNQDAPKNLDRHAKRGDQLVTDYVPVGKFKTSDELTFGDVSIKGKELGGRVMGAPQIGGSNTLLVAPGMLGYDENAVMNQKLLGVVNDMKSRAARIDPRNPRLDLNIASDQLSSNFAAKTFSRPAPSSL